MKKCLLIGVFLLLPVALSWGQSPAPADTGAVAPQKSTPADTAKTGTGADTAAVSPPPADTGAAPPPSTTPAAADTAAAAPPPGSAPTPATAKPVEEEQTPVPGKPKRLGLGIVFNDESPVSARLWFNPTVGLDAGVGLRGRRVLDETDSIQPPTRKVSLVDFNFDLGVPVRVLRRDRVDLIMRPGFAFRARPNFFVSPNNPSVRSIETTIEMELNGTAGFEYYPTERASFSLLLGLAVIAERPGGTGRTITRLESLPSKKGVNFSFRYYVL